MKRILILVAAVAGLGFPVAAAKLTSVDIGVKRAERVLCSYHHREQCQGALRFPDTNAKMAADEMKRLSAITQAPRISLP